MLEFLDIEAGRIAIDPVEIEAVMEGPGSLLLVTGADTYRVKAVEGDFRKVVDQVKEAKEKARE